MNLNLLDKLIEHVYGFLPKLIFAILFIFICWILLKLILFVVKKSLKFTKIDYLTKKLNDIPLFDSSINIEPVKIILIFVKWFLILMFIIIGSELLNLDLISNEIGKLISYLPKFFSAIIILIFGLYGANYVKKSVRGLLKAMDINGSKLISNIIFVLLSVIVCILVLNQAGFNTDIITNNLFLILGAFLASFALAFGLGSRDIILRLLLGFYSRKHFYVGQRIIIEEKEGVIIAISDISLVVAFEDKKIVYPVKYIANNKIEIIE